jgi:hypothetical protein
MSFEPNPTLLQQAVALLVASQAPGANQVAVQPVSLVLFVHAGGL